MANVEPPPSYADTFAQPLPQKVPLGDISQASQPANQLPPEYSADNVTINIDPIPFRPAAPSYDISFLALRIFLYTAVIILFFATVVVMLSN
ncbi:hypothetical protein PMAYCL1PPCAC_27100 [Pristionchus mayeri]|uniref:Uncharacterized protein n=1 Tax=Pristionchus mayeri TaxID=1317129 RepID=A0AAN5D735_9BILA|nr:hypothetical protein PMAYCL1PPCAC_27097 [Pristionchus mayeri]GMR56905.1 hypothetical protein PMAYCL1PPCAC_27100 [Pristionchus mayeri]